MPGGARERGGSFEHAAVREARVETGIEVRLLRRRRVPREVRDVTHALFLAVPITHNEPAPRVGVADARYLRGAAWHPINEASPLGPLSPDYRGYLVPILRRLVE